MSGLDDVLTIAAHAVRSDRAALALPPRAVRVLAAALLAAHGYDAPDVPGIDTPEKEPTR